MHPKHEKLLADLALKTNANSINWEASEVTDQFVLKLKNGAVMFDRATRPTSTWGDVETYYSLKVLNKVGDPIDEFNVEGRDMYELASTMFERIRRRVNRIDEQLDEIISEIDAS
jgi:hypothetical protein